MTSSISPSKSIRNSLYIGAVIKRNHAIFPPSLKQMACKSATASSIERVCSAS